jgi:hypothetical protein
MKSEELRKVLLGFSGEDKKIIIQVLREQGYLDNERVLLKKYNDEIKNDFKEVLEKHSGIRELNNNVSKLSEKVNSFNQENTLSVNIENLKTAGEYLQSTKMNLVRGILWLTFGMVIGICLNLPFYFFGTKYYETFIWIDFILILFFGMLSGLLLCKYLDRNE